MNNKNYKNAIDKIEKDLSELNKQLNDAREKEKILQDKKPYIKKNKYPNLLYDSHNSYDKTGIIRQRNHRSKREEKFFPAYYNSLGEEIKAINERNKHDFNESKKMYLLELKKWESQYKELKDQEKSIVIEIEKKNEIRDELVKESEKQSLLSFPKIKSSNRKHKDKTTKRIPDNQIIKKIIKTLPQLKDNYTQNNISIKTNFSRATLSRRFSNEIFKKNIKAELSKYINGDYGQDNELFEYAEKYLLYLNSKNIVKNIYYENNNIDDMKETVFSDLERDI